MMTFFQTTVLALIEGLTEFLPISSTGHLILASRLLQIPSGPRLQTFEIFIQAGAICAVVILYSDKLRQNVKLWKKLLVGFLPAAIIGLVFLNQLERVLDSTSVVLTSLFLGGVLFLAWDQITGKFKSHTNNLDQVSFRQAFLIGLAQSLAFIPGVSRAAASIFGGLMVGLEKQVAVEFSFLLAIPTIFAAASVAILKSETINASDWFGLGWGFVLALVSALVAIRFFLAFLKRHSFVLFGWYRIILAIAYALILRLL